MLKKTIALITFCIFMLSTLVVGHQGRTDEKGGHWNHKTKTYHYHTKGGKTKVDKAKSRRYKEEMKK